MSYQKIENIKVIGKIIFGTDSLIKLGTSHQLQLIANNSSGSIFLSSGTGGISLDSTSGSGSSGSQNGPILLVSKAASSWINSQSNLSFETLSSGDINISSVDSVNITANSNSSWTNTTSKITLKTLTSGDIDLTSAGAFNFNSSGNSIITVSSGNLTLDANESLELVSTTVNIGTEGGVINVLGNLHVSGTTTTVNSTNLNIGENAIILNSSPSGSNIDSSILMKRSGVDITTYDSFPTSSYTTGSSVGVSGIASYNSLKLNSSDTTTAINSWIKITSGLFSDQIGQVVSIDASDATIKTNSSSIQLTGSSFFVSSSGTVLTGVGSLFTSELQIGQEILVTNDITETYYVSDISSDTIAILTGNTSNIEGVNCEILMVPWDPIDLASGTYTVSGSSGSMIVTCSNDFTSTISSGCSVQFVISGTKETYYVTGILTSKIATLSNTNLTTGSSSVGYLISPGSGLNYNVYNNIYAGIVFKASSKEFRFETTLSSSLTNIEPISLLDIVANKATLNNISLTGETISSTTGSWSTGSYSIGSLSGGVLSLLGGLSSNSNMIIESSTILGPLVDIRQCSSTAEPVLSLTQANYTAPILTISGKSSPLGTGDFSTYTDPTKSIVSAVGNGNITGAQIEGYFMVNLTDNSSGTNPLTSGSYYIPIYSLNS